MNVSDILILAAVALAVLAAVRAIRKGKGGCSCGCGGCAVRGSCTKNGGRGEKAPGSANE